MVNFCPKCGKNEISGDFCSRCDQERHPAIEHIKDKTIHFCMRCDRYQYGSDWKSLKREQMKTREELLKKLVLKNITFEEQIQKKDVEIKVHMAPAEKDCSIKSLSKYILRCVRTAASKKRSTLRGFCRYEAPTMKSCNLLTRCSNRQKNEESISTRKFPPNKVLIIM